MKLCAPVPGQGKMTFSCHTYLTKQRIVLERLVRAFDMNKFGIDLIVKTLLAH